MVSDSKTYKVGKFYKGEGIFIGEWSPKDTEGESLNKTFNLFAAPKDLVGATTFNKTIEKISKLNIYQNYPCAALKNDTDLYNAIINDTYKGEWFIPTMPILIGNENLLTSNDNIISSGSLYIIKDERALKGTFNSINKGAGDFSHCYWSITEDGLNPISIGNVDFLNGDEDWDLGDEIELSTRLVRAIPKTT